MHAQCRTASSRCPPIFFCVREPEKERFCHGSALLLHVVLPGDHRPCGGRRKARRNFRSGEALREISACFLLAPPVRHWASLPAKDNAERRNDMLGKIIFAFLKFVLKNAVRI